MPDDMADMADDGDMGLLDFISEDSSPKPVARTAETEEIPEPSSEPPVTARTAETDEVPEPPSEPSVTPSSFATPMAAEDDEGAMPDFVANKVHIEPRNGVEVVAKPWMDFHKMELVKSVEQVRQIVDDALAHGRCGLDLETEGLDNRIDYDENDQPYTRHKIVGYCISVRGHGYYIPIRHKLFDQFDADPNLSPDEVDAEIKRLCLASQPVLTEAGRKKDPYSSVDWEVPPRVIIYFWNSKFDQEFLYPVTGIDFWHPDSYEDGYLAAYVYYTDDRKLGLKLKAPQRLSINGHPYEMIELGELFPKGTKKSALDFSLVNPRLEANVVPYGCSDAICTEILCEQGEVEWDLVGKDLETSYKNVLTQIVKSKRFSMTYKLEKQTTQAVRVMERSRTLVDKDGIGELLKEAHHERDIYLGEIQKIAEGKGFKDLNPGSPKQLSKFLFEKEGLDLPAKPERLKKSGLYKTDAATLEGFVEEDPDAPIILRHIVRYRQVNKVIGTYLTGLAQNTDEHNQLRFNFKQTGAATGRFTAPQGEPSHGYAGIPIHGIPGRVDESKPDCANSLRRLFISHPGYTMIKIDYAGQELRVVTNVSKEPLWTKEFLEGSGDLHTLTAQAFFGPHITKANKQERAAGKQANFALIYGGGVQAVQRATKCDKHEAARKKKAFDASVPKFAEWVKGQHAYVKKNLGVLNGFQRFIRIPDANIQPGEKTADRGEVVSDEKEARKIRAGCERKSTNYPIQSSGADILKISFTQLVKKLHRLGWLKNGGDDSVRMLMTIHDEIVFEVRDDRVPEALPVLIKEMESPSKLVGWEIPLVVEPLLGRSWDAKYDWLEIQAGKEQMPEWLVPHFEAYEKSGPSQKTDVPIVTPREEPPKEPLREPSPPPSSDKKADPQDTPTPDPAAKSPLSPKPKAPKRTSEVVVFQLPTCLPRRTQQIVKLAITISEPIGPYVDETVYKRLRVLDGESKAVLVQTDLNIRVEPETFRRELQARNLGSGAYDLIEEP